MMDYNEVSPEDDALYAMSDEELDAAFKEAKGASEDVVDEVDVQDEVEEEVEDDVIEDDVVEDLEQPNEDSDEDGEEVEVEKDEESEVPDGEDEDKPESEEAKVEEPEIETFKYKANGQDFEFSLDEIKEQFGKVFGQSMNYTQKMQEIAPWRKTISALKDSAMSHEDVNLMIDVLVNKDKDAIATMLQKTGIDTLDIDTDNVEYSPKEYGRSEEELAIDDVVDSISRDPEYKITQHVVDNQWDSKSRQEFAKNPGMISGLHNDIKSGVFDKVSPMAMKLKVLDGGAKSDIQYYIEAGSKYYETIDAQARVEANTAEQARAAEDKLLAERKAVDEVKTREAKQTTVKKAADKRKAAAPTKKAAGTRDVIDYLDDSDSSYDDWYNKLQASM